MKTPLLKNEYNVEIELENQNDNKSMVDKKRHSLVKEKSCSFESANSSMNYSISISDSNLQSTTVKLANSQNMIGFSPQSVHNNNNSLLNGTASALLCRICYTADNQKEPLLQPCNCSGTMGLMHQSCLEKWLSQSNSNKCEICNFEFSVKKIPKSFGQWLFRPLTTKDTKNLFNDFVCFLILTPLAYISTWYCVLFALKFHETENKWEASGLVVLTSFLLFIYILWFIFSCKYHYKVFKEWQEKNQIVTLKLNDDSRSLNNNLFNLGQPNQAHTNVGVNGVYVEFNNNINVASNNVNKANETQITEQSNNLSQDTHQKCSILTGIELDLVEVKTKQTASNQITDETYLV